MASPPNFELMTPTGLAGVSIRESPPRLTDAEFQLLVEQGMQAAMPGSTAAGSAMGPFPTRRFVWHVNPVPARGVSRVVVNVFDGAVPFAYEQEVVDNSVPDAVLESAVASMTRRLVLTLEERGSHAPT
jgi:hypothetical protein